MGIRRWWNDPRYTSLTGQLQHVAHSLQLLHRKVDSIMADQDTLEAAVQALTTFVVDVEAEIARIQAQPGATALDFTTLNTLLDRVKTDDQVVTAIATTPSINPGGTVTPSPVVTNVGTDPNVSASPMVTDPTALTGPSGIGGPVDTSTGTGPSNIGGIGGVTGV